MGDHDRPDPALVQRFYSAFLAADGSALGALLAPAFELHVAGRGALAGIHRGAAGLLALRARIDSLSSGTFRPWRANSVDVAVSDHHAVLLDRWVAEHDGQTLDSHAALVVAIEAEKVATSFAYFTDQYAFDAFFAR